MTLLYSENNQKILIRELNEEITIPQELANQYLSVKRQMVDKQAKKDQIMKSVNAIDNEINILSKNLLAIETKAAQMQGIENQAQQQQQNPQGQETATVEVEGKVKESLDEKWQKYIAEGDTQDLDDFMNHNGDWAKKEDEEPEDLDAPEEGEALEGDYVFTLRIKDEQDKEDIIAKFYKNEDDDFWRVRVVQGEEDPLENMQFDPELGMIEVIEQIAEIPGYSEVEEMETDEYQTLLDDKEIIDNAFYDDIIQEE